MIPALAPAFALSPGLLAAVGVVAMPADTRCPGRAEVAGALADRIPDGVVGWVAAYAVEADGSSAASRIRFELHDNDGQVRLRRELTVGAGGCAAAADGLAMIVERYFEGVSWTAAVPLPEIVREPEPDGDGRPPRRAWELQGGLAARSQASLVPALAIDARVALARGWWAVAGFVVPTQGVSAPVPGGVVRQGSLPLRASARWRVGWRALAAEVGPAASLTVERVVGTPPLANGAAYRGVLAAGAVASGRWWLSPAWAVAVELGADLTLYAPAFVALGQGEVLFPSPVSVLGMVAISRAFSL